MSAMVRGGATKPTGRALAGAAGAASVGTATATLARPLAAFIAARTQARTLGVIWARHEARLASKLPEFLPPMPRTQD